MQILIKNINTLSADNYFLSLKELNRLSGINDYEKLDNLLWLLGKLKKGSFSILMEQDKYKSITSVNEIKSAFERINANEKKDKSASKDNAIREYIRKNYKDSKLFSEEEKQFFEFAFSYI